MKIAEFIKLHSPDQKPVLICQWVQKCYEEGRTVAVHVASAGEAAALDKQLWTFSDQTFIPHVLASKAQEPVIEPVTICCGDEPSGQADVLIEAAGGAPGDRFRQFDHVFDFAEVFDDALREQGRARYKACQEAGYKMRFIG